MKKVVENVPGSVGDPVRWLVDGATTGVITDRTKTGEFRATPDKRGYHLVKLVTPNGHEYRRRMTQLEVI